jgi:hypothetical protein
VLRGGFCAFWKVLLRCPRCAQYAHRTRFGLRLVVRARVSIVVHSRSDKVRIPLRCILDL